jgi:hypothetical protein
MLSLRLNAELDQKVRRAAAIEGESVSEFIRRAAESRADGVIGERQSDLFRDVAGVVNGGGGRARNSGKAFAEGIARDRRSS